MQEKSKMRHQPLPDLMAVTEEDDKKRAEDLHQAAKIYKDMIKESKPVNKIDVDKLRTFAEKYVSKEKIRVRIPVDAKECPSNNVKEPDKRPPAVYSNSKSLYGINYNED